MLRIVVMRPLPLLLIVLVAVVGAALGFRVMTGAAIPQATGHLYTGCAEEPSDVNPLTCRGNAARRLVLAHTHDGLLETDPITGALRPAVAEHFELAPDRTSCTFTLRDGVRFADGSLVTLDDVLFGWRLAQAGHATLGFIADAFARVQSVERLDDRRFRVGIKDPHYAALRVIGTRWLVVQQRFFVDRVAKLCAPEPAPALDSPEFAARLSQLDRECGPGTGAYRFDNDPAGEQNWLPHQQLVLTRNEHSWRRRLEPGAWSLAGFRILFRDPQGQLNALLRGELDWYGAGSASRLLASRPELAQDYRALHYDYDALGVFRVVWHCGRAPTDDVRVRRALGMLFDIAALQKDNDGIGERALAHCKPESPAYPRDITPLPFDPAAARAALREAGYDPEQGKPLRLCVITTQGTEVWDRFADLFADACQRAGVELELRRRVYDAFVEEKKLGDWHGYVTLQSFRPWGDPWDFVHSQGSDNDGGYANPDVDRLADAARVEPDAGKRDALWREMHELVYRDQPAALLAHPLVSMLLHRRVQGAVTGGSGLVLEHAFVAPDGGPR